MFVRFSTLFSVAAFAAVAVALPGNVGDSSKGSSGQGSSGVGSVGVPSGGSSGVGSVGVPSSGSSGVGSVGAPSSGQPSGQPSNSGSAVTATNGQCNTGSNFCCNTVQDASSQDAVNAIASLVNVATGPITGQVGLTCDGVVDLTSCTQQPTCCSGNNFSGLVVVGCTPINAA